MRRKHTLPSALPTLRHQLHRSMQRPEATL